MFLFYCFCHLVLSHRFSTKPREIGLLGSRSHSKASTGCPIEIEQVPQVKAIPKHASDKCEQADKTMLPAAQPGLEAEQHIEQQSAPNLPAHGIGAMAEEIAQVERLFDLAEEGFNGPAAAIQFADRMGRPLQIISQKFHHSPLAINLHPCRYPAHRLGIILTGFFVLKDHQIIAQNIALGLLEQPLDTAQGHVLFGPGDKVNAPQGQVKEVGQIDVGLVKQYDFTGFEGGAHFAGSFGVIVPGRVDDGKPGQKTFQIQAQVTFGGRLSPTMFSPIHAVGDQTDSGRIDDVDNAFETTGKPLEITTRKPRRQRLQVLEHRPKQFSRHRGIAMLVGVGKPVATGSAGPPDTGQQPSVMSESVTDIIKPNSMSDLSIEQTNDMAPWTETASFLIDTLLAGQLGHQMSRNKIAKLSQNAHLAFGWICFLFFHSNLLLVKQANKSNSSRFALFPMGCY